MPQFSTTWVADYAVMTITIDNASDYEDAEQQALELLSQYTDPALFNCDEIEPYDNWLDKEDN